MDVSSLYSSVEWKEEYSYGQITLWEFCLSESSALSSASANAAAVPIQTARELRAIETEPCRIVG